MVSNIINIFIKERDKNVNPQPAIKFILRKTLDL